MVAAKHPDNWLAMPNARAREELVDWLNNPTFDEASRRRWLHIDWVLGSRRFEQTPVLPTRKFINANRQLVDERMKNLRFVPHEIRIKRTSFHGQRIRVLWLGHPSFPEVWHIEMRETALQYPAVIKQVVGLCERLRELPPPTSASDIDAVRRYVASIAAEDLASDLKGPMRLSATAD